MMRFFGLLARVIELLQRERRVSYGALKREFGLEDMSLEDLKAELIEVRQLAVDQDNKMLVWTGAASATPAPAPLLPQPVPSLLPRMPTLPRLHYHRCRRQSPMPNAATSRCCSATW